METTFFTFNNFLLSRSLSVQASPTHRLLLFAFEAGDFPDSPTFTLTNSPVMIYFDNKTILY